MTGKDKILEKVRALIAKADSTPFSGEADVFRAKADELMTAYTIEQWQVEAAQGAVQSRPVPERRDMDFSWWYARRSPFGDQLWDLMQAVAYHCRCKCVPHVIHRTVEGRRMWVVGLPADLDYMDMLFTSLHLQMSAQMTPKPSGGLSYEENLAMLKEAGMKWERIGELLYELGQVSREYDRNMGVKFTKDYARFCQEEGRIQMRTNPQTYQNNFAWGFVERLQERLRGQRDHYDKDHKGTGTELALQDIRAAVDGAAVEMFGRDTRPVRYVNDNRKTDWAAREAGERAGAKASISGHQDRRVGGKRKELS